MSNTSIKELFFCQCVVTLLVIGVLCPATWHGYLKGILYGDVCVWRSSNYTVTAMIVWSQDVCLESGGQRDHSLFSSVKLTALLA